MKTGRLWKTNTHISTLTYQTHMETIVFVFHYWHRDCVQEFRDKTEKAY